MARFFTHFKSRQNLTKKKKTHTHKVLKRKSKRYAIFVRIFISREKKNYPSTMKIGQISISIKDIFYVEILFENVDLETENYVGLAFVDSPIIRCHTYYGNMNEK